MQFTDFAAHNLGKFMLTKTKKLVCSCVYTSCHYNGIDYQTPIYRPVQTQLVPTNQLSSSFMNKTRVHMSTCEYIIWSAILMVRIPRSFCMSFKVNFIQTFKPIETTKMHEVGSFHRNVEKHIRSFVSETCLCTWLGMSHSFSVPPKNSIFTSHQKHSAYELRNLLWMKKGLLFCNYHDKSCKYQILFCYQTDGWH